VSLLAAPSQWEAWTCDWNFNIQSQSFKKLAITRSYMCMHHGNTQPMLAHAFQHRQS
jgi:hypothetical protein